MTSGMNRRRVGRSQPTAAGPLGRSGGSVIANLMRFFVSGKRITLKNAWLSPRFQVRVWFTVKAASCSIVSPFGMTLQQRAARPANLPYTAT